MKKILVLVCAICFSTIFVSSVLVSAKDEISVADIHLLKGKWEGYLKIYGGSQEQQRSLEVLNDDIPLKGVLYIYGGLSGNSSRNFDNGIIEKGKLVIRFEKYQWIRLALRNKKGKLELRGDFRWADLRGDWTGEIYFEKVE